MTEEYLKKTDVEAVFRSARRSMKPEMYTDGREFFIRDNILLNAEQIVHSMTGVLIDADSAGTDGGK